MCSLNAARALYEFRKLGRLEYSKSILLLGH